MDFIEVLQTISSKIGKQKNLIKTEEATKNAFVMPFISALGYDVFDPAEVVPEFIADVGIKKGEKVDYAIKHDGKIIMLFECKCCNGSLDTCDASQLYRYFSVTEARIAVLTDGVVYRFYTDIEEPNKMDPKPFMEFNMLDIEEPLVIELKRLTKETTSETDNADGHQNGAVTPENANRVVTTPDELEAYYIVKAITCAVLDAERIVYRDTQSYFSILCDDNNRKPICRLHFNGRHKYIGILDANKNEERVPIDNLNEIYKLADKLRATAGSYVNHNGI